MSLLSSTAIVSTTNSCDSLVPQNAYPNPLEILPEDVFVTIFRYLSESMYGKLSLVSKQMNAVASSDSLWASIARPILLPQELEARHNTPFKDYSKDLLCLSKIGPANANEFHILKPRSPALVDKINQATPPQFQLLKPKEAQNLLQEKDSSLLIKACIKEIDSRSDKDISHFCFEHVAQQKIGKIRFDFFNCTDYLISLDKNRTLWIDNKKTRITFTEDDCQLLIYKKSNNLHIFNSDLGKNRIEHFKIPLEDLKKENPQDIRWFQYWRDDQRVIVKDLADEVKKRVEFWPENSTEPEANEWIQQEREKIRQLNVPNLHLLNQSEIDNLMDDEHTINLIAALMFAYIPYPHFGYVTQQKIGPYQIDTFNNTNHMIHVNAEGELFLNNQRILNKESQPLKFAEEGHRQFFIYGNRIFYKKVGDPNLKRLRFEDQEGREVEDFDGEGLLPKCQVSLMGIIKGISAVRKDERKINEHLTPS